MPMRRYADLPNKGGDPEWSGDIHGRKLKQVCGEFRIRGEYQSYEEIKVGNVDRTYKVNCMRDDGKPKSYIVQEVSTYAFKNPVQVVQNPTR